MYYVLKENSLLSTLYVSDHPFPNDARKILQEAIDQHRVTNQGRYIVFNPSNFGINAKIFTVEEETRPLKIV